MRYIYKSKPYAHQEKAFELSAEKECFAFLMEQGTGKTKPTIDTAAYLFETGKIDAVVIAAPNGVHRKWFVEDFPLSMPDRIPVQVCVWKAQSAPILRQFEALVSIPLSTRCLRVFMVNIETLSTRNGEAMIKRFLDAYRCLFVIDESGRIKNPGTKRTDAVVDLGGYASYRRILNGLPVSKSPFDLFSQFQFLDPSILGKSYIAFKARHADFYPPSSGIIKSLLAKNPVVQKVLAANPNANVSRWAPQIVITDAAGNPKYKNLDRLKAQIAPYSFRVTKKECLDLPDKVYTTRFFEMTQKQRAIYDDIDEKLRAEINDELYIVKHQLTKKLRLQQITSGFMGTEPDVEPVTICVTPEENPRLMLLKDTLKDLDGSVIIWARFRKEIEWIKAMLGDDCVTYYGGTDPRDKAANLDAFKSGRVKYLAGTAASGGIGHNFTIAHECVYYSNTFDYDQRAQSEDRQHRIGQTHKVTYYDLQAEMSVDQDIVASLRAKQDLGDYMMGKSSVNFASILLS